MMAGVKRAHSWEISDSETEEEERGELRESKETAGAKRREKPLKHQKERREEEELKKKAAKQAQREEKERKKQEREKKKQERQRQKEEKQQEQMRRRKETERIKRLKPEEYLKTVTLRIHPVLLQDSGCDILLNVLEGLKWKTQIEEHELTHTISWNRQIPNLDIDSLNKEEEEEEENQVLMVVSQIDFMDIVTAIKQVLVGEGEKTGSLYQALCEYLNRKRRAVLTLLVTEGAIYNCGASNVEDVKPGCSHLRLNDIDIEEVFVYLQLYKNVSVHFLNGWQEVTNYVCSVTKALSKRPVRLQLDVPNLGFCVDGTWARGVRVEKSGSGLAQVWTQQVQQLNRVSVPMATAVTNAYPSPQMLLQGYEMAESEDKQRKLLEDLRVMGGANERRIGPELSNRVYRLMTSQNPELVLD